MTTLKRVSSYGVICLLFASCSDGERSHRPQTPEEELVRFFHQACLDSRLSFDEFDEVIQKSRFFRAQAPGTKRYRHPHSTAWTTTYGSASLRSEIVDISEVRTCAVNPQAEDAPLLESSELAPVLTQLLDQGSPLQLATGELADPPTGFTTCGMTSDYVTCRQRIPAPYVYWRWNYGLTGEKMVIVHTYGSRERASLSDECGNQHLAKLTLSSRSRVVRCSLRS